MSYLEQLGENLVLGLAKTGIMPADFANIGQALGQAGERRLGIDIDTNFILLGLIGGAILGFLISSDGTDNPIQLVADTLEGACVGTTGGTMLAIIALEV